MVFIKDKDTHIEAEVFENDEEMMETLKHRSRSVYKGLPQSNVSRWHFGAGFLSDFAVGSTPTPADILKVRPGTTRSRRPIPEDLREEYEQAAETNPPSGVKYPGGMGVRLEAAYSWFPTSHLAERSIFDGLGLEGSAELNLTTNSAGAIASGWLVASTKDILGKNWPWNVELRYSPIQLGIRTSPNRNLSVPGYESFDFGKVGLRVYFDEIGPGFYGVQVEGQRFGTVRDEKYGRKEQKNGQLSVSLVFSLEPSQENTFEVRKTPGPTTP